MEERERSMRTMRCLIPIWVVALSAVAFAQSDAASLLAEGKYAEAEAAYRDRVESAPQDVEARIGLVRALMWQAKFGEAEKAADAARTLAPSDPDVLLALARVYFEHASQLREAEIPSSLSIRTRYGDAEELCSEVLKVDPGNVSALKLRGDARFWLEDIEGAASDYATALKEDPNSAPLNASLGDLFVRYLQRYDEAIPYLEKAVGVAPNLVDARRDLAHAYRAVGDANRAVSTYLTVLEQVPDDAETYEVLWDMYAGQQKYAEAEAVYERILEVDPDSTLARWHQAHMLQSRGEYPEAIEKCREILERKPDWNAVRNFMAGLQQNLDRTDQAVAQWVETLTSDPQDEEALGALLGMARTFGESREYDPALEIFDRLVALVPEDAAIRADRALTLYNMGRTEDAIQAYLDAVQIDPYDSQILNDLALAYQGVGDYQKAIEYLLKSIEIDNNLDAKENYAVIIMKFGEIPRAINMFTEILSMDGQRDRSLKYFLECRRKHDLELRNKQNR
jgi:superkiller protein 3